MIKSSVDYRIETLTGGSGNSIFSHAGKVKILISHIEKLASELDMKSFDDSWKEEVSNSVKLFETMSFKDSDSNVIPELAITLAEVNYAVKALKNNFAKSDGIVSELIKCGVNPMLDRLLILFNLVWDNEYVPTYWKEGLTVSLFNKKTGKILVSVEVFFY